MGFLVAAIGVVFLTVASLALRNMLRSERSGRDLRGGLLAQIKGLRLHDMLRRTGRDPARHVQQAQVATVRAQLRRCEACAAHCECDAYLAEEGPTQAAPFCPNADSLSEDPAHP